jgi:uncharacterized protein (TIGR00369 family)
MDEAQARQAFDQALASYEAAFGRFFLARLFALDFTYAEDRCIIRFPVRDFLFNPQGTLHGGVLASIMDISMGHLLHHSYGKAGATIEMKVQYLRPLTSGMATCTGQFIKRGRSIAFLESRVEDEAGKLAAMATSTWKCTGASEA